MKRLQQIIERIARLEQSLDNSNPDNARILGGSNRIATYTRHRLTYLYACLDGYVLAVTDIREDLS